MLPGFHYRQHSHIAYFGTTDCPRLQQPMMQQAAYAMTTCDVSKPKPSCSSMSNTTNTIQMHQAKRQILNDLQNLKLSIMARAIRCWDSWPGQKDVLLRLHQHYALIMSNLHAQVSQQYPSPPSQHLRRGPCCCSALPHVLLLSSHQNRLHKALRNGPP